MGSGTIGNGHFALFLSEVTGNGHLSYEYKGEEMLQGRRLARYDYRVPVNVSGHSISLPEGRGTVGMKGSFWADPATYDIVRIAMEAEEIPLKYRSCPPPPPSIMSIRIWVALTFCCRNPPIPA